jgi:sugar phosphate isomerase/epimerase
MQTSLNPVIFGPGLTLEDQIRIAAEVGFDGIDTSIEAIAAIAEDHSVSGAKALFDEKGVQPAAWGLPVDWRGSEDSFRSTLESLHDWAKLARDLMCFRCCTWIPPVVEDPAETRRLAVSRFGEIASVLAPRGIRLGLEWVGPKTSRASGQEFIYRMDQLLELIDEIGQPNVGLLVDSFHWFTAGHTAEDLAALEDDQIVHVHINDAPDKPRDEQIDMQRLLPGEGVIDLPGFLRALREVGYSGYMGVETFSDDLKALPPEEAARRAKVAVDSVL